ncbi:general secretion pathway protein M [Geothermobacter ehrlichii]|uniref:General secretion pathway protein M n=1 Tax=Geothermobacter ehrlichii TaxID=213224 RepID=A0A5D3WI69_9BACT|nr:type II secretion system protein GspM [Geothermobacter ehrlichii]TYO97556.1 general secretion pathway protein M [Geothermobacter ehrlichii]
MLKRDLTTREKGVLAAGGAILLLLLLVFGAVLPFRNHLAGLDQKLIQRQKQVRLFAEKLQEYRRLQAAARHSDRQVRAAVPLMAFVESTATQMNARDKLVALRPQPVPAGARQTGEAVEIRFERIRLDQLVRFLYTAETAGGGLATISLRTRVRFEDPALLDAVLVLAR